MQNNIILGSYYPVKSKIHFMNPISKLLSLLLFIVILIICNDIKVVLLLTFVVILLVELAHLPGILYFKTFKSLEILMLFLIVVCYIIGTNIYGILNVILKLYDIVLYISLITLTTPQAEIVYGITKVLSPFKLIFLPVNKISFYISQAFRFIPTLIDESNKVMKSQASRGLDFYASGLIKKGKAFKTMFVSTIILSFRQMELMNEAMQVRLYSPTKKRTNFRINKWGAFDTIMVCMHIVILFIVIRKLVL